MPNGKKKSAHSLKRMIEQLPQIGLPAYAHWPLYRAIEGLRLEFHSLDIDGTLDAGVVIQRAELVRTERDAALKAVSGERRQSFLFFVHELNRWIVTAEYRAGLPLRSLTDSPDLARWRIEGLALLETMTLILTGESHEDEQTVSEASTAFDLPKWEITRLCNAGKIRSTGTGRARRVSMRSLATHLLANRRNGHTPDA